MQFLLKDHLEKLEGFLVIAEKGSIRKASESLGVTQPALSRQIHILEDVLEQPLVERTRQGVELTEAGKLLRDFSRSLLRDAEDIERKIRKPQEKLVGNIIIGTFESLSIRVWPKIVADLRRQFPRLQVGISTGDTDDLYEGVLEGKFDIGFGYLKKHSQKICHSAVLKDRFGFFCSETFAREAGITGRVLDAPSLVRLPVALVKTSKCVEADALIEMLDGKGLKFRSVFRVDTYEAAANYAMAGVGIAVLPTFSPCPPSENPSFAR